MGKGDRYRSPFSFPNAVVGFEPLPVPYPRSPISTLQGFEHFRLLSPTWRDFLEVGLVAFVLYRALLLFQRTRAVRILLGLVLLVAVYLVATVLKLGMITYLLGLVFQYGAIAL